MKTKKIEIYCDGSCEPTNPGGTSSYGFIIFNNGNELYKESAIVTKGKNSTNNVAEYAGLLNGLRWLYKNKLNENKVICYADSKLVIEQMSGRWQMKKGVYIPWALKCKDALPHFTDITFQWIPREENVTADFLSRSELKKAGIKFRIQPEG